MAGRTKAPAAITSSPPPSSFRDFSYDSSPDPLQASFTETLTTRPRARASKSPMPYASPTKRSHRGSSADQVLQFSSPSKSMILNTGKAGDASPWRIKVTVQAEPGSGDENMGSPSVKRVERRNTTTVPLRGGTDDEASPAKRRGRPKKSDVGASATMRRPPTPVRKRRQQFSPRKTTAGNESDASAAEAPIVSPPKKRRGRPRKSPAPEEDQTVEDQEEQVESLIDSVMTEGTPAVSAPAVDVVGATPQETPSMPRSILKSSSLRPNATQARNRRQATIVEEHQEEVHFDTPPQRNTRSMLKARKGTPHAKKVSFPPPPPDSSSDDMGVDTPAPTDEEAQSAEAQTDAPDDTMAIEEQLEALRRGDILDDDSDDDYDAPPHTIDDGTSHFEMPEDTTMFESENFTMISMDSLPSLKANTPLTATDRSASGSSLLKQAVTGVSVARNSPEKSRGRSPKPNFISLPKPTFQQPGAQQLVTPATDAPEPAQPPPPEQPRSSPHPEARAVESTVRAGAALQGLVEADRIVPITLPERRGSIDGLFRGFSDSARKELRASLELGQELASQPDERPRSRRTTPANSSPKQPTPSSRTQEDVQSGDVFTSPSRTQRSRLLTPEEHENYSLAAPPELPAETDINYPALNVEGEDSQLVSPELSDEDINRKGEGAVQVENSGSSQPLTATNAEGGQLRGANIYVEAQEADGRQILLAAQGQGKTIQGSNVVVVAEGEDPDIWQEEASRSFVEGADTQESPKEKHPPSDDIWVENVPAEASRRRVPRDWRRKGAEHQRNAEAEKPTAPLQQQTPSSSGKSGKSDPPATGNSKEPMVEPTEREEQNLRSDPTTASDDTGIFFQPEAFKPWRRRVPRSEKVDTYRFFDEAESFRQESSPASVAKSQLDDGTAPHLSSAVRAAKEAAQRAREEQERAEQMRLATSFLDEQPRSSPSARSSIARAKDALPSDDGQSFQPSSSPTPATTTSTAAARNPFKGTPPQFISRLTVPVRSSPLRQEYHASGSEGSFQHTTTVEESTLPLGESSPFNTHVDMTGLSLASHEQQLRHEMEEGRTSTSILNIREEADALDDAYSMQHRSMYEIEEVTEPSRSRLEYSEPKEVTEPSRSRLYPSSPPEKLSRLSRGEASLLLDDEQSTQLHSSSVVEDSMSMLAQRKKYAPLFDTTHQQFSPAKPSPIRSTREPNIAVAPSATVDTPPQPQAPGLLTRLTSTLFGAASSSTTPTHPETHPVFKKYTPLPKTKPWTKSHYKTLDSLYQRHLRNPSLFSPSASPTNQTILHDFLDNQKLPFLHSTYSCWGYSVTITPDLLVLSAIFLALLRFKDIDEYESVTGREIDMGNCNPGVEGVVIEEREVVKRLATVIMGEALRRDEKMGKRVVRRGGLVVDWAAWGAQRLLEL